MNRRMDVRGGRRGVGRNGESGEKCKFIVSYFGDADQSGDGILVVAGWLCVYMTYTDM